MSTLQFPAAQLGWRLASLPILATLTAGLALAQFNSSIEGAVTDATQAGVPGAEVMLVNELAQVSLRTTSSDNGFFRITQLAPGNYHIEVRRPGFKSWVQTNLELQGSERLFAYRPIPSPRKKGGIAERLSKSSPNLGRTSSTARSLSFTATMR